MAFNLSRCLNLVLGFRCFTPAHQSVGVIPSGTRLFDRIMIPSTRKLQALAQTVWILGGDSVEFGNLRPAAPISQRILGHVAEPPVTMANLPARATGSRRVAGCEMYGKRCLILAKGTAKGHVNRNPVGDVFIVVKELFEFRAIDQLINGGRSHTPAIVVAKPKP